MCVLLCFVFTVRNTDFLERDEILSGVNVTFGLE